MKFKLIIPLTTIFIILLSGCSSCGKDTTGPDDEEFVNLSENTIIMEETTLSAPVIDSTTYTYTFTGEPPDITEGDVIIGQTGAGYLRKVTNATISENELILDTDQACFTDAIKECNIDFLYEFNLGGKKGNKLELYPVYLANGVSIDRDRGRLSLDNTILFSGTVNNTDLVVEITEGSVNFEPTLNTELEISLFEIQHLLLSASGNLEFDCDLTLNCNAPVSYSDEIIVAIFYSPPFMFGPVPMILELSFVAGFETELDITGDVTSGFDSNASVEFGAEYYSENGWATIWNKSIEADAHSISWGKSEDVYSKGYITPQLSLKIAGVAGPYMEVETYLDFEGVSITPNWEWELAAGLNGNLGFEVEILCFTLIDYYTTLLNLEVVIANDSGQITNNPPELPSNPNPSDNATGVSITTDLSWECSDPDVDPLTYDVYFGTDPTPDIGELVSSGQSSTNYEPGNLDNETTYYWKIVVEDDHSNSTTGNIWEFITGTTPEPPEMIFVQGGTFEMGDHYNEGNWDELPVHSVTLDNYYIGKYEVTHAEYIEFLNDFGVNSNGSYNGTELIDMDDNLCAIGYNGSSFYFVGSSLAISEECPVVLVTWYGAAVYCNWRSQQEGLTSCFNLNNWSCDFNANGYRLPTEAEWEYAARGGINWTDDYRYSGCHENSDLTDYAWYNSNSSGDSHPVGMKLPNQIEIHDMSGNVWEWCNDWYDVSYYSSSPSNNPQGPANSINRVMRGSAYCYIINNCRVANRFYHNPDNSFRSLGFRCVVR